MKIIITEDQFRAVFKRSPIPNHKPAVEFDKKYGTELAGHYDFSPYTEDDIWNFWLDCRDNDDCDNFKKTFEILPKAFPYINMYKLTGGDKRDLILGMVSGFNPADIVWFTVKGVKAYMNIEQKELEGKLPNGVRFGWVLSPESLQQVREKFEII